MLDLLPKVRLFEEVVVVVIKAFNQGQAGVLLVKHDPKIIMVEGQGAVIMGASLKDEGVAIRFLGVVGEEDLKDALVEGGLVASLEEVPFHNKGLRAILEQADNMELLVEASCKKAVVDSNKIENSNP